MLLLSFLKRTVFSLREIFSTKRNFLNLVSILSEFFFICQKGMIYFEAYYLLYFRKKEFKGGFFLFLQIFPKSLILTHNSFLKISKMCPHRESNLDLGFRKPLFFPIELWEHGNIILQAAENGLFRKNVVKKTIML